MRCRLQARWACVSDAGLVGTRHTHGVWEYAGWWPVHSRTRCRTTTSGGYSTDAVGIYPCVYG